ncbi:L,D-transpeptidase [Paenibacillus sp. JMULE4]|uniref:L,D-transpeptidase n=1 Tax=Paenibacillus sp. JMULE4 TaxID=2518342 RepID=UPI0020C678C4|nr:L,D-transpeptidase [Paenibacillus sp. JMULE4]
MRKIACGFKLCFMLFLLTLSASLLAQPLAAAPKSDKTKIEITDGLAEEGVYLIINKTSNRLTVVLNGRVAYSFPVATGRTKQLTPTGRFHIVTKIVKPWYVRKRIPGGDPRNPLGSRWMGINVPGTGGYTYGIHGTNRPYSIGSSASSGCIRMHNRDVEWLFRHIPLGIVVIILE